MAPLSHNIWVPHPPHMEPLWLPSHTTSGSPTPHTWSPYGSPLTQHLGPPPPTHGALMAPLSHNIWVPHPPHMEPLRLPSHTSSPHGCCQKCTCNNVQITKSTYTLPENELQEMQNTPGHGQKQVFSKVLKPFSLLQLRAFFIAKYVNNYKIILICFHVQNSQLQNTTEY